MNFIKYEMPSLNLSDDAYMRMKSDRLNWFKEDALKELGLTDHPKADWAVGMAWKHGHEGGFEEVFFHLKDLAAMLVKEKNESDPKLN